MSNINQTINIITENQPGVLYRIAGVFLRRKINIENLMVTKMKGTQKSRFTIDIALDEQTVIKLIKQIEKIIEVIEVSKGGETQ